MLLRRNKTRLAKPSPVNSPGHLTGYYSADYFTAKCRFLVACERLGFDLHELPIDAPSPTGDPLTIDVAVRGAHQPTSALVVSSGVHGVEGFFGAAVQLAFLENLSPSWRPPENSAIVFIHALNPFGFAMIEFHSGLGYNRRWLDNNYNYLVHQLLNSHGDATFEYS